MEVDSIKTISCELKDLILKQLADGRNHDVNDIKAFVQEKSGLVYETDYTKSHLAGSLFQLVNKNKIQKVERGVYRILGEVPAPEKEEDPKEGFPKEGFLKEGFLKEGFGTGFFDASPKVLAAAEPTVQARLEELDRLSRQYCQAVEKELRAISAADLQTDEDFDFVKKIKNIIGQIKHLKE